MINFYKAINRVSKSVYNTILIQVKYPTIREKRRLFRERSSFGHFDVVKKLLPRVDPSDVNDAIRWASENGHFEVVRLLLSDPRVDPADDNNEAIRLASRNGHFEVVRLLLADPRVDPSENYYYAIS